MDNKNEPLTEVMSNYDLETFSIETETYKDKKGVWWVQTSDGYKVLKKMSNAEATLKHILAAIEHLSKRGVLIPRINKTLTGDKYVIINDNCYILSDAINGRTPNYNSQKELSIIVKGLANFHKASREFEPAPDTKPKIHLGRWIEDYNEQLDDMNNFYKQELDKERDVIGETIVKEFPYFYDKAVKVIKGLEGQEYRDWVDKVGREGGLCHQDFAAGNLILTPSDQLYVLDFDSITIDIPARDIRKLFNKVMKKNGKWDAELAKNIIAYYQSENPLTPSEWEVVRLDLMFPHLFLGAINKYFYQRDKEWSSEKYLSRIKAMAALEKTAEPVLKGFDLLVPE